MFVDHLQLADFRSYDAVDVALGPGVTIFVGANGQGKTNLVEAVEYLSTLGSHRVASDQPLVRAGAERAIVRARVDGRAGRPPAAAARGGDHPGPGQPGQAQPVPAATAAGAARRCCAPWCSPRRTWPSSRATRAERRRFLDELIIARWPRMAGVRADYDRVLRQRNTLLKSLVGRPRSRCRRDVGAPSTSGTATSPRPAPSCWQARLSTLADLVPHVAKAYADIAPTNNDATAEYKAVARSGALRQAQRADQDELTELLMPPCRSADRTRSSAASPWSGRTATTWCFSLGTLPAKGYASHGESWSFALALQAGQLPAAPGRRGRAGADPGRRVRRARHHPAGAAGRRRERRRAGAGHRRGRRRRPRAAAGPPLHRGRRRGHACR